MLKWTSLLKDLTSTELFRQQLAFRATRTAPVKTIKLLAVIDFKWGLTFFLKAPGNIYCLNNYKDEGDNDNLLLASYQGR